MRTIALAVVTALAALAMEGRAMAEDEPSADLRARALEWVRARSQDGPRAPSLPPALSWLNVSRPLADADLRGRVVLLDFWCYCCINCIHVMPTLERLEARFADAPFLVVGVHSAKFANEKETENIREAVRRYEIRHPVVNDADFRVWRGFGARAWPTFVLMGPDGRLLWSASGERTYEEMFVLVEAALKVYGEQGLLDPRPLPLAPERATRAAGALAYPGKVAAAGDALFVADSNHNRILELGLDGTFRRAWGDGERGLVDGDATKARFFRPQGMAVKDGVLWVADTENHAIRRIDLATGIVSTVAGDGTQGFVREGTHEGRRVRLSSPWDLAFVGPTLFVAMAGTHQIWTLDPATGRVSAFAGDGRELRLDAEEPLDAAFAQPSGLAFDGTWLWIADSESSSIVRMGRSGPVETFVGASDDPRDLFAFGDVDGVGRAARLQHPLGVALHEGTLYVADSYNHRIKALDPKTGRIASRWGTGEAGFADDPARFDEPGGIAAHRGALYVADTNNHAIRRIDPATGRVTTLALDGVPTPMAAAREGGVGTGWHEIPEDEVEGGELRISARAQVVTLLVRPRLAEGEETTEGAPALVRVEAGGRVAEAPLVDGEARPTIEVRAGDERLVVRGLFYVCDETGACSVRARRAVLRVVHDPDATGEVIVPIGL
jgi:sugar lactone lactonase YvrE/thiol-disulfide isomerase/thioredoxin